jgi:hypothetical protein
MEHEDPDMLAQMLADYIGRHPIDHIPLDDRIRNLTHLPEDRIDAMTVKVMALLLARRRHVHDRLSVMTPAYVPIPKRTKH